jgi:hypothetical protein
MGEPATVHARETDKSSRFVWWFVALSVHTAVIYVSAIYGSPWLVAHWFRWILPLLSFSTSTPAGDWYLQHLELVSIVPAFILGYLSFTHSISEIIRTWIGKTIFNSAALWAWTVPAVVLAFKMSLYHAPTSVLYRGSVSTIRYFFEIQKTMPMWNNLLAGDPVRGLTQMIVTAPFYTGIAYSFGALASKYELRTKLFPSRQ